jgi:hypothetical protein
MNLSALSVILTVGIAFIGYFLTYWNNLRLARHQAHLDLVNRRLNEFYGPLFIITRTMSTAYQAQLSKSGKGQVYEPGKALTQEEWEENYAWVVAVYAPLEDQLSDLIVHKAHLLREPTIPASLLTLVAHVSVTQALIHKWKKGDFSELYPVIDFPHAEITAYAERSYADLKAEQLRLLGRPG